MSTEIYKGHAMLFYGHGNHMDEIIEMIKELEERQIKVIQVPHKYDLFKLTLVTDNGTFNGDNVARHLRQVLAHEEGTERFL